jgi:hypothetical protein
MCDYVTRRLRAGQPMPDLLAIMGGDARTGTPMRYFAPTAPLLTDEEPKLA